MCQAPASTSGLSPPLFGSPWPCHGRHVPWGLGTRAAVDVCAHFLHNWYFSLGPPERTCMNSFLHDVKHLAVFITCLEIRAWKLRDITLKNTSAHRVPSHPDQRVCVDAGSILRSLWSLACSAAFFSDWTPRSPVF